jgi:hypothetical protein
VAPPPWASAGDPHDHVSRRLRGKAREFDADGVCGTQKLIVTGDIVTLVENFEGLFPGATLRHEPTEMDHEAERLSKLAYALMTPGLEDTVPASNVAELMGVEPTNRKLLCAGVERRV